MNSPDVPSPIDWQLLSDAVEWESRAMARPFRMDFFEAIAAQLRMRNDPAPRILELGAGPGFLAAYLLEAIPGARMSLLDFSPAMHELAGKRLAAQRDRVDFILRNLKEPGWAEKLGRYDAVVTVQAVHELRHKRYAEALHRQVKNLLKDHGCYLVCDHYLGADGMANEQLYMTLDEQRACLAAAGYRVNDVLIKGGRSLYHAA